VSTVGGQLAANPQVTAYLTAYRLQKQAPNVDASALVLKSAGSFLTALSCIATNQ
jgi:hypothetical protein